MGDSAGMPHCLYMATSSDNQNRSAFAHVVLFRCPQSGDPIAASFGSNQKNLEEVDAHAFKVYCLCGWTGTLLGVSRFNSWTETWNT